MATYTKIKITVDAKRAIQRMHDMKRRGRDFVPLFEEARIAMEAWNSANFTQGGLPSGKRWNALSADYSSWKRLTRPGAPLMVRSGRLFRSLVSLRGNPNVITPLYAEFGTDLEYAKFHQYGTTRMPKRKIVFEPPMFARRMGKAAARYQAHGLIDSSSLLNANI